VSKSFKDLDKNTRKKKVVGKYRKQFFIHKYEIIFYDEEGFSIFIIGGFLLRRNPNKLLELLGKLTLSRMKIKSLSIAFWPVLFCFSHKKTVQHPRFSFGKSSFFHYVLNH
jgi:hypothetical protein